MKITVEVSGAPMNGETVFTIEEALDQARDELVRLHYAGGWKREVRVEVITGVHVTVDNGSSL